MNALKKEDIFADKTYPDNDRNYGMQLSLFQIQNTLDVMSKDLNRVENKIDKQEGRQWQIIVILLSYPIGLMIGKICHIF